MAKPSEAILAVSRDSSPHWSGNIRFVSHPIPMNHFVKTNYSGSSASTQKPQVATCRCMREDAKASRFNKLLQTIGKICWFFVPVPYQVGPESKYKKKSTGLQIPGPEVILLHAVMAIAVGYFI